ncbi:MAG TPA: isoprenyl transferase [Deltaproteobacteria bacterium]|nr:isoprenyl transferase [Deltaproteobacteria bacterium]
MELEKTKLPRHVAIIMDGNGRWAEQRNLDRIEGHIAGTESVRDVVTCSREVGVSYLTLYAFSKENWSRPKEEVNKLWGLLQIFLQSELELMQEKDIRFNTIGAIKDLPKKAQRMLANVMDKTKSNRSLMLTLALSYSGRQEILHAIAGLVEDMKKKPIKRLTEKVFTRYLYTSKIPDPDLLIRTSGEMRLSNFLLWQMAYTEILVTDTLWPDFRRDSYLKALQEYTHRERRFGALRGR